MDNGTLEATLKDGSKLTLIRSAVENDLELGMIGESRLEWLIANEITTYVELYLSGGLQDYCTSYERNYHEQTADIQKQLEAQYENKEYAAAIAREIMMYS